MSLKRLTDASRNRLLANPKEIGLCFEMPRHHQSTVTVSGFLRGLFGASTPESHEASQERDPCFDEDEYDLEKTWDVLCFLLCDASFFNGAHEKSFPSNFLFMNQPTVDIDNDCPGFGYGPPWIYSSQEVKDIAIFLDAQTEENLYNKFVPSALQEAAPYPTIWDDYNDADSPEWQELWKDFFEFFPGLKKFVRETADRDLALLIHIV